ncbi:MAG: carboxypeptidase regulatory-like domain-containing protein, partial [Dinghuibacter sp.]|nr:carboxypeptidase regulatory-like domain-containing protein [Dinghuibacter sp.]
MKLKHLVFTLLCAPVIFFHSCQSEISGEFPPNDGPQVNDAEKVTASITGVVVNENDVPVAGVTVNSHGSSVTTNNLGMFRIKNIEMSKANATVKVEKSGYFTAYRTFPATAGRTHSVRIKLIPKTNSGNFPAATGGTITIAGGGKMVMPANAVSDAAGNPYTGTVNVAMAWINPMAADLNSTIMGDLRGITTSGQERALETYGMLGVELTGSGGQKLNIATGKTAELTFP